MDKQASPGGREKEQRGGELVIPVLALAFTAYYIYSIQDAPWTAKVSTYAIASILSVLALVFIALILRAVYRGEAGSGLAQLAAPIAILPKRLALFALTLAYTVALPWAGFTLTTFIFLYAAMLVLGGSRVSRSALIVALAYALSGYLLFMVLFGVRFPEGPFEQFVQFVF